jgi:hypothetical protein
MYKKQNDQIEILLYKHELVAYPLVNDVNENKKEKTKKKKH